MTQYNKVEFVFQISDVSKVLAFVECARRTISFGQPKTFGFTDYKLPNPRDNYERTTIHRNGEIIDHFNLMDNSESQSTPLAEWNRVMYFTREFYDVGELSLSYLPDVQPDARTKQVPIQLQSLECKIWFAVVPSIDAEVIDRFTWFHVPEVQCWTLSDNWPIVIVGISNLANPTGHLTEVNSVGRDYSLT